MKTRKTYFDVLRIIAIFLVLYCHTGELALLHYTVEGGKASYWLSIGMQQFSYICNGIFFFISGALLLKKDESIKTILSKRALKYLLIIVIFGLVQYGYNYYQNPLIGFSWDIVTKVLYSSNVITQYWFLHSYLAFILMLPILRMIARQIDKKTAGYLIVLLLITEGVLLPLELLWDNSRIALSIPLFDATIILPVLGYCFENLWGSEHITKKELAGWNIGALITIVVYVWYGSRAYIEKGSTYSYAMGLSFVLILALYLDIRLLCEKLGNFNETKAGLVIVRVLSTFGKGTFVVYLFNNILSDLFKPVYYALYLKISWFGAAVVWLLLVILAGTCLSFIYESIKKLILKTRT